MPQVSPPGESSNPGPGGTAQLPASSIPTTGPVTPLEIYLLLLNAGASTTQAIGIMANAVHESQLDPEAVGDGGTSFGFVQFHQPGYAGASSLVTGNPQADIRAQITYLFQHVSPDALAGSTPAEVAGNFAANFERCVGCQPGGAQNQARVASAAAVAGWVSSGAWPTSSGSAAAAAGAGSGSGSGSSSGDPSCLITFPGVLGIGSFCMFRTSWARAMIGGTLIAGSVPVGLVGAIILAAFTFRGTGAGQHIGHAAEAVGGAVALIPGAEGAGAAVAALGSAEARHARRVKQEVTADKAQKAANAQARNDEAQYKRAASRRADGPGGRALREDERLEPVPF